jgi:site-specific DNA-cytosine methylase
MNIECQDFLFEALIDQGTKDACDNVNGHTSAIARKNYLLKSRQEDVFQSQLIAKEIALPGSEGAAEVPSRMLNGTPKVSSITVRATWDNAELKYIRSINNLTVPEILRSIRADDKAIPIFLFRHIEDPGRLMHRYRMSQKPVVDEISERMKKLGYQISVELVNASDYGVPQMRKRLFIVGVRGDTNLVQHIDKILDFDEYKKYIPLTEFLGKNFEKQTAYTIRCGGRNSPINDRHNWDGYIVDGKEYRLSKEDCLKLQGFNPEFKLCGNNKDQWKQLGNTIPTVFTRLIGLNLLKYM